ncbi:MAG: PKD domain-containing protein [Bacteroidales bacterium]|nr:PKD domain-containing protein [Bacteroidales bacterium]
MTIQKITYAVIMLAFVCSSALFSQQFYEAIPLSVNTPAKELAPAFYENGLVFCSDRKNEWFVSYTDMQDNPLTNLYITGIKRSGKFEYPQLFSRDITTRLFEGPATFTRDGKKMYFTRSIDPFPGLRKQVREDTTFGIFTAELVNGQWTNVEPFPYNSTDCNVGYPCLSPDGMQMFFCSNDPSGTGGFDLYVTRMENGTWSKPENLGNTVNTPENEVFPFLHENGRLFFASRGYKKEGDLEIYYSEYFNGQWGIPVVLPDPINSDYDDYGLIMNPAMDTGYFVSDRAGSPDILQVYSTIPTFSACQPQEENSYCYIFYESNNAELDTTAFAYEWDLGDGTKVRSLRVDHCYPSTGIYNVELNVIDKLTNEVYFSQASYRLVVENIEQPYITAPDSVFVGEPVTFSGQESFFKEFEIGGYYWNFGDGGRAASVEARHIYSRPGIYVVELGLTSPAENFDSMFEKKCVTRKIVVLEKD